ncbi:hypothetical protein QP027_00230 [Corynebacterium breve]|uniref:DUF2188 domain-containing protein n=1 Tax=Corynebacterium breve TaxID=3049799 RepID=A0ABY8VGH4_9CORY|nr:hypothetical protein [Corynebacterium breve]WIM67870.1 hypothetical protein QP027_00230 [Corynebacterium breve]
MSDHPVLAVVDKQEGTTVIWRVATTPGFAPLSGAWIVASEQEVTQLTRDAVVISVGQSLNDDTPTTSISAIAEAMGEQGVKDLPDLESTPAYSGEPEAQAAWTTAVQAAQLVEAWHAGGARRRTRGEDTVRVLPTPTA